jgi:hypothetical protein
MYLRHNGTQEFIGDLRDISQPTVSRIITVLVPTITVVLEEFVPNAKDAIRLVRSGRRHDHTLLVLCGASGAAESKARHHRILRPAYRSAGRHPDLISDPLPGNTHDKKAFDNTATTDIIKKALAGIGDKGYQGADLVTPTKKPRRRKLGKGEKKANAALSALRASIERVVAHFKNWRILHTDYRRPYTTYRDAFDAARALFFFSISWGFE